MLSLQFLVPRLSYYFFFTIAFCFNLISRMCTNILMFELFVWRVSARARFLQVPSHSPFVSDLILGPANEFPLFVCYKTFVISKLIVIILISHDILFTFYKFMNLNHFESLWIFFVYKLFTIFLFFVKPFFFESLGNLLRKCKFHELKAI